MKKQIFIDVKEAQKRYDELFDIVGRGEEVIYTKDGVSILKARALTNKEKRCEKMTVYHLVD